MLVGKLTLYQRSYTRKCFEVSNLSYCFQELLSVIYRLLRTTYYECVTKNVVLAL